MGIAFGAERWQALRRNCAAWWRGELERPLVQVTTWGRDPGRTEPRLPRITRATLYDPAVRAEDIVDRWDYELACREYLGDAFPCVWADMGPGVAAAFIGADAKPTADTVWFGPRETRDIRDLRFEYDPDSPWLRRLREIYAAAVRRWQGQVQVGMTDLGGNLDILASFRPGEQLLLDLCDHPDEVKRLTWEAHDAWWRAFEDLNAVLQPLNPGYTAWTPIFSAEPYYILQCDFCYMIGPSMFDEFVRPELARSSERLANAFYHLDGVGQLPHLDSLLSIDALAGVQWVPGAGRPQQEAWPDVHRRIRAAGKRIQIHGGAHLGPLTALGEQLGTMRGIVQIGAVAPEQRADAVAFLERCGCPAS